MKDFRPLRIFAASPSDMAPERARIDKIVSMLKPLAEKLGIVLQVLEWGKVVPDMGRPEKVILGQLNPSSWDVFIGLLWHRFGSPPGGADMETRREYLSGTEEEFITAHKLWKRYGKPRIMMYRCARDIPQLTVDADQWKRVNDFFSRFDAIKGEHPGLYKAFGSVDSFEEVLFEDLQRVLLEYEELIGEPLGRGVAQEIAPAILDNLPPRLAFFGREEEIAIALRTLSPKDRTWGVLLDGIGGIGKTALAVETAYRTKETRSFDSYIFVSAKEDFLSPDGIRELKPAARTLEEFLDATARSLGQTGIAQLAGNEKRLALLDALRGTRTLLVYDNLETLTKVEQEGLADFLRELPGESKAIITSRRRGGEGGVWVRLEKLEWEAARSIILNEMRRDGQLEKKLKKVSVARWLELYDETRGSPLVLVHTLGLMRVRSTLTFEGAMMLLRANRDPDLNRFIFREANKELTPNDESTLRALSFFAPSASFDSCVAASGLTPSAMESSLNRLSKLSLVDALVGEERYALHPLTRTFVREELLGNDEIVRKIGNRFVEYWTAYAKEFGGSGKRSHETYDHLEAEWQNLDVASQWLWQSATREKDSIRGSATRFFCDFANALGRFLLFSGRWDELLQMNVRLYEATVNVQWDQAGWGAYHAAWVHLSRGEGNDAAIWAERCLEAWLRGGKKAEQAEGLRIVGEVAARQGKFSEAAGLLNKSLGIYRQLKSPNAAKVLFELGKLQQKQLEFDAAEQSYLEALTFARKASSKEEEASYTCALALLMADQGILSEARTWIEASLPLAREVGRKDFIALTKFGLARVHEADGNPNLALPLAEEAAIILEQLKHTSLIEAEKLVDRLKRKIRTEGRPS